MPSISSVVISKKGFTLIEIIIVMALMSLLSTFAVINLLRPQTATTVDSAVVELVSDLRSQQIKAMVGDANGSNASQPHGIYFETNKYILFSGLTYDPLDPTNTEISLKPQLSLNTTFASSEIIFSKRNGEVADFADGQNTITIIHTETGQQKTITVNRYGVISIN